MDYANDDLTPPARLAIVYAPKRIRSAFSLLLRFDARLAAIVGNAKEPLIGQMKLAWWRDALSADEPNRPKGEPYLSSLFALNDPILTSAAISLVDAWEYLVVEENWLEPNIDKFGSVRGTAVFSSYARMAALTEYPESLARKWAMDDLRLRFGERVAVSQFSRPALPRKRIFRPLTILAMSVTGVSGLRLVWHALTGR